MNSEFPGIPLPNTHTLTLTYTPIVTQFFSHFSLKESLISSPGVCRMTQPQTGDKGDLIASSCWSLHARDFNWKNQQTLSSLRNTKIKDRGKKSKQEVMKLGGFLRSLHELLSDRATAFRASQPLLHTLPYDCESTPKLSPRPRISQGQKSRIQNYLPAWERSRDMSAPWTVFSGC